MRDGYGVGRREGKVGEDDTDIVCTDVESAWETGVSLDEWAVDVGGWDAAVVAMMAGGGD